MQNIPGILVQALQDLGLSNFEARIFSGLVLFDAAEAKELVDLLAISKPSVYEGLDRLEERGLVVKRNSKPAMYSPVQPEMAIRILMESHAKSAATAIQELKKLEMEKIHTGRSDAVWTMFGDANVERKIQSMIRNAKLSIECLMSDRYLPLFDGADLKDISVSLLIISDQPGLKKKVKRQFPWKNHQVSVLSMKKIMGDLLSRHPEIPDVAQHIKMENIMELIIDDAELLSIPPIATQHLNGLNTSNKALILHSRAMNEGFWSRMIRHGKTDKAQRGAAYPDP